MDMGLVTHSLDLTGKIPFIDQRLQGSERTNAIKIFACNIFIAKYFSCSSDGLSKAIALLKEGGEKNAIQLLKIKLFKIWNEGIPNAQKRSAAGSIYQDLNTCNNKSFTLRENFYQSEHPFPWPLLSSIEELHLLGKNGEHKKFPEGLLQLPHLKKLNLQWSSIEEVPKNAVWHDTLEDLTITGSITGLDALVNLQNLTVKIENSDDLDKLEDVSNLQKLQSFTIDLYRLDEIPANIARFGPLITKLSGRYVTEYPKTISSLVNISMRDRYQRHNQLLFSLLNATEIERAVTVTTSFKSSLISQLNQSQIDFIMQRIDLYYHNPKELERLLIKESPDKQEFIEKRFEQLGYLREWIAKGSGKENLPAQAGISVKKLPFHSDYLLPNATEKVIVDLVQAFKRTPLDKLIVNKIELGESSSLRGKKRVNMMLEIPVHLFQEYFQIYLLAYAKNPKEGDLWQAEVMRHLADVIIAKVPKDQLTEEELSALKDALIRAKTWVREGGEEVTMFWADPCIHFKSAWFPIDTGGYSIAEDKRLFNFEMWYRSIS